MSSNNEHNYEVKFLSSDENEYEGNIIVKVFDVKDRLLKGAKVTVFSDNKNIGEIDLGTTSIGVFYEKHKTISVLVTKEGYEDVKTNTIEMNPDKACLVVARLRKK